jgi:hypothetical protein
MEGERKRDRTRDLLIGGALGALAAVAALRRRKPAQRTTAAGLAAFEDAPCFREALLGDVQPRRPRGAAE